PAAKAASPETVKARDRRAFFVVLTACLPRLARKSLGRKLVEIRLPAGFLCVAEFVKIVPGEDAAVVEIAEGDAYRVVAHRLDLGDRHILLAGHGDPLVRRIPLHFCGWRQNAQQFGSKLE